MNVSTVELTALIGIGSLLAGFLGALTGLGGGVVIVPLLTIVFHVDLKYAIGAATPMLMPIFPAGASYRNRRAADPLEVNSEAWLP